MPPSPIHCIGHAVQRRPACRPTPSGHLPPPRMMHLSWMAGDCRCMPNASLKHFARATYEPGDEAFGEDVASGTVSLGGDFPWPFPACLPLHPFLCLSSDSQLNVRPQPSHAARELFWYAAAIRALKASISAGEPGRIPSATPSLNCLNFVGLEGSASSSGGLGGFLCCPIGRLLSSAFHLMRHWGRWMPRLRNAQVSAELVADSGHPQLSPPSLEAIVHKWRQWLGRVGCKHVVLTGQKCKCGGGTRIDYRVHEKRGPMRQRHGLGCDMRRDDCRLVTCGS